MHFGRLKRKQAPVQNFQTDLLTEGKDSSEEKRQQQTCFSGRLPGKQEGLASGLIKTVLCIVG